MTELDRTQQRIIGVLIEKELAVPDTYPLTENALLAGCNQKSNRDPEMALEPFEVHGALVALMAEDWVKTSTSMGSRVTRYAHRIDSHYSVSAGEKAVLCELLVRGPQASGALKQRVARLAFHATPDEIESVLQGLSAKIVPMAECLAKRPRERDCRWRHRLGAMDPTHEAASAGAPATTAVATQSTSSAPGSSSRSTTSTTGLEERVARLERAVEELRAQLGSADACTARPHEP